MSRKLVLVDTDLVPKLLKVIHFLIEASETENESSCEIFKKKDFVGANKRFNIAKEYGMAAKKCLVSHRFICSAKLLDVVCQQPHMNPVFFFKAASVVLENNLLSTEDDFFKFTCHIHGLVQISKYEVTLEYLMHSLRRNDLEGYSTLEAVIFGQRLHATRNFIIDPLLKAYIGLLQYLKWARNKGSGTEINEESVMKVVNIFKDVVETPGQWDIFVFKLVEMLQSFEKYDEIEIMLTKYVEMNPEHINSFIYLCEFLKRHKYSVPKHLENLKELAKRCPSDPQVLTLVDIMSIDNPKKALTHLFMFLDYPVNTGNVKAWKLLAELLINAMEKFKEILKKVLNCWLNYRKKTWNFIHFSCKALDINDETNADLAVKKSVVLCILESSSHPFVLSVLELLLDISPLMSENLRNKITVINCMKDALRDPKNANDLKLNL